MSEDEVKSRRDLRDSHLIFSIDPKGCEDVDDTLSVRYCEITNLTSHYFMKNNGNVKIMNSETFPLLYTVIHFIL